MEYIVQSPNKIVFTEDEVRIIREYADGVGVSKIAEGMKMSVRTVEAHMAKIRAKLGVKTTPQVIAAFFRNKIIE